MRFNKLFIFIFLVLIVSCKNEPTTLEIGKSYLEEQNFVEDHTIDSLLSNLLPDINCIASTKGSKYFVLEESFNVKDTNQIVILPFRSKSRANKLEKSGFSKIEDRLVYINPLYIKDFVSNNSLNKDSDIDGYLGIVLLHELSHFLTGVSGSFDENNNPKDNRSGLGQIDMHTEPIVMTKQKKLELKVDSLAVTMIKAGLTETKGDCFSTCFSIQLAISGAEFMTFGKRTIENFGTQTPNMIKDNSLSHPNIELRLAFMNYYLNPAPEKLAQIQDYIYEREVAPVRRQETDPRIYQGN